MQEKQQHTYIQGIRGISIFLIVLFHLLPSLCPNGYMGVDVFFVISGYFMLGKQLNREKEFRLFPFLKQKGQRLLVPYFSLLFLVAVCSVVIFPAVETMNSCGLFNACFLGKANIFLDHLSGNYFSSDARALPLMHLWYMGVLMQILLFFSLLFFIWQCCSISNQARRVHLMILGIISLAISFLYLFPLPDEYSHNTYYWTSARLWEFVLGGFLYPGTGSVASTGPRWVSVFAVSFLFICSFIPLPNNATGIIIGALCGTLLLLFGANSRAWFSLENKFFVWLGGISFSLYLVHWPCICFAEYIVGHQLTGLEAAALILIILPSAYLFYRAIEKPRFPFALLPILALSTGLAYKGITMTKGFAHYLHQDVNQIIESSITNCSLPDLSPQSRLWEGSEGISPNHNSPHVIPDKLLKELGDTSKEISFIVMGDSHASDLAIGMHLCGLEYGWHGIFLNSYVVPFWGAEFYTSPSIAPGNFFNEQKATRIISWLKQHPSIKTVFIAQYWDCRQEAHSTWSGQKITKNIFQVRSEQLRQFCQQVKGCGKKVVLLTDAPKIPSNSPRRVISSHLMWQQKTPIPSELCCHRCDYDDSNGVFNKEMDQIAQEGLCHVLHREHAFFRCDTFVAYNGTHLTHRDSHHLYPFGCAFSLSNSIEEIRKLLVEP